LVVQLEHWEGVRVIDPLDHSSTLFTTLVFLTREGCVVISLLSDMVADDILAQSDELSPGLPWLPLPVNGQVEPNLEFVTDPSLAVLSTAVDIEDTVQWLNEWHMRRGEVVRASHQTELLD
jgi:hypothetical protein